MLKKNEYYKIFYIIQEQQQQKILMKMQHEFTGTQIYIYI